MSLIEKWQKQWSLIKPSGDVDESHAGVLVLCERAGQRLILTKRAAHLKKHAGEFCFVGGLWQGSDDDLLVTALREAHEELNLTADRIELIRLLPSQRSFYGVNVTPILAVLDDIEPYIINPDEVASIASIPLEDVVNLDKYESIHVARGNYRIKSLRHINESYFVWGLTAKIMHDLAISHWRSL